MLTNKNNSKFKTVHDRSWSHWMLAVKEFRNDKFGNRLTR